MTCDARSTSVTTAAASVVKVITRVVQPVFCEVCRVCIFFVFFLFFVFCGFLPEIELDRLIPILDASVEAGAYPRLWVHSG